MPEEHARSRATPQAVILGITSQLLPARCIAIAAELGLADALAERPQKAEELAEAAGAHGPSLFRMLRFLASLGIFHQEADGTFRNTEQSEVLRRDIDGSIFPLVRQGWQDVIWNTYRCLPEGLRTGEPAYTLAHGQAFFDHLASYPELGAMFDAAMALMSGPENDVIAETYPIGKARMVIDIGGGRGGLLASFLAKHKGLKGILFDQAKVIAQPDALIEGELEDRCERTAGNFFESVPDGADIYLLKRILHDWGDEDAVRILTCVRKALSAEARVAIIDAVIQPGNEADSNKYLDLGIMTLLKGRERTAEEFEALLSCAGLRLLRILPTPAPSTMSIVEAALV